MPVDSWPKALAAGALWGWLPCGLVYSMLTLALASGDPARGALVMAGFGLGTLPAVGGAGSAAAGALRRLRGGAGQRAAGVLLAVFGVWTAIGALPHGDHPGHAAPAAEHHHH